MEEDISNYFFIFHLKFDYFFFKFSSIFCQLHNFTLILGHDHNTELWLLQLFSAPSPKLLHLVKCGEREREERGGGGGGGGERRENTAVHQCIYKSITLVYNNYMIVRYSHVFYCVPVQLRLCKT